MTTYATDSYSITLENGNVSISDADGVWVGSGRWVSGSIVDCAARLGADEEASEDAYCELERGLRAALAACTEPDADQPRGTLGHYLAAKSAAEGEDAEEADVEYFAALAADDTE